jgi:hypothetical protein
VHLVIPETEVLITSQEKDLVKEKIGIAMRLWEKGIKTEYIYEGKDEDILPHCQARRIPVFVVINNRQYSKDMTFKVKSVFGRLDSSMNEVELINFLLQRKYTTDLTVASPTSQSKVDTKADTEAMPRKEKSSTLLTAPSSFTQKSLPLEIQILNNSHQGKGKKLQTTVSDCVEKALVMLGKMSSLKVYTVDIPIAILKEVAQAWDPSSQQILPVTGIEIENRRHAYDHDLTLHWSGLKAKYKQQLAELKDVLVENRNVSPFVLVFSTIENQYLYIQTTK